MKIMHATCTLLLLRTHCCLVVVMARVLTMCVATAHYTLLYYIAWPYLPLHIVKCMLVQGSGQSSEVVGPASVMYTVLVRPCAFVYLQRCSSNRDVINSRANAGVDAMHCTVLYCVCYCCCGD